MKKWFTILILLLANHAFTQLTYEHLFVDYDSAAQKNNTNKFPIVRFTTKKEELFTLPSPEGFLPARVKMGKKVFVLYNPQNPKEFTIQLPNEQLMFITLVGAAIATKAQSVGISTCVFDRGGNLYHGRVKAVADGAREGGLQF